MKYSKTNATSYSKFAFVEINPEIVSMTEKNRFGIFISYAKLFCASKTIAVKTKTIKFQFQYALDNVCACACAMS